MKYPRYLHVSCSCPGALINKMAYWYYVLKINVSVCYFGFLLPAWFFFHVKCADFLSPFHSYWCSLYDRLFDQYSFPGSHPFTVLNIFKTRYPKVQIYLAEHGSRVAPWMILCYEYLCLRFLCRLTGGLLMIHRIKWFEVYNNHDSQVRMVWWSRGALQ